MKVVIIGHELPGRTFCDLSGRELTNVHVGVQLGKDPAHLIAGDAAATRWVVDVREVEVDDGVDFRGPAVHGKRGERFLYLTWVDVDVAGGFEMFRRAKLMLDRVPAEIMAEGMATGVLVARVSLTDAKGGPRCARVDPPAIAWAAG
ncbi:MAG: DUF5990 family protein [Acidimicrobiales bacterium]